MLQKPEQSQGSTKSPNLLRPAICAIVLTLSISACSGDKEKREDSTLTANQVCDSTLDSTAAKALRRMGNTEKFAKPSTANGAGTSDSFLLERAANTLYEDMTHQNQCFIFKADDDTGHPLVKINFSAAEHYSQASTSTDDEKEFYPFGLYAATHGNNSATIYFKCPTTDDGDTSKSAPYVKATLYSSPDQVSSKSPGRDLITVLNSVSRRITKQLGCESQAGLPTQIPEGEAN